MTQTTTTSNNFLQLFRNFYFYIILYIFKIYIIPLLKRLGRGGGAQSSFSDLDPLCSPDRAMFPAARLKGLVHAGDQPGKVNQLSEHMVLGRGHSLITTSPSRCGYVILGRGPCTDRGRLGVWPGDTEVHWHP